MTPRSQALRWRSRERRGGRVALDREGVELGAQDGAAEAAERGRQRAAGAQPRLDGAFALAPRQQLLATARPSSVALLRDQRGDRGRPAPPVDRGRRPASADPRAARCRPRPRRAPPGAPPPSAAPGARGAARRNRAGPWRPPDPGRRAWRSRAAFRRAAGTGAPGRPARLRARARRPARAPPPRDVVFRRSRPLTRRQATAGSGVSPSSVASVAESSSAHSRRPSTRSRSSRSAATAGRYSTSSAA